MHEEPINRSFVYRAVGASFKLRELCEVLNYSEVFARIVPKVGKMLSANGTSRGIRRRSLRTSRGIRHANGGRSLLTWPAEVRH